MEYIATMARHTDLHEQFRALIERNRGIVFKVASTYAWQADDREELAQEIATQLWRAFPGYDQARPFATWMYRIALNVAITFVRANSRLRNHAVALDEELHDLADGNAADHESEQQVRALRRFIHAQEPLNRALLLLYLEDRSYREMADVLGISETNVATKINRLKQRIRNEI